MTMAFALLAALLLDCLIGWPEPLYRRIGHPVTWIGRSITWGESLNTSTSQPGQRIIRGAFVAIIVVAVPSVLYFLASRIIPPGGVGFVLTVLLAWPLIAARSLYTHVADIAAPLAKRDLNEAREKVAMIVGRDPNQMSAPDIARAAIESLAENTSDGVTAPLFWGVLLGLPGLAGYKAINTLDSMIGYRNEKYQDFGKFAARLDDVANLIPARVTGLLYAVLSPFPKRALAVMWRDARRHRSPNAGFPEAAVAGALSIRLSGPRVYHGEMTADPWLNPGADDPDAQDIMAALRLYRRVIVALALILLMIGVFHA